MWLWFWGCAADETPTEAAPDTGSPATTTVAPPGVGCDREVEPLTSGDAPLGFSADELVEALPIPDRVAWDYSQTSLAAEDAPGALTLAPFSAQDVSLVTYTSGGCAPEQQLVVTVDLDLDIGAGGVVARGPLYLYAWGTGPDEVDVWSDDALTLELGEPFAGAFDAWGADAGWTIQAAELRLGSRWSTLGVSLEVDVDEDLVADLWAGKLVRD
jgi:hypothetical protein